MYIIDRLALQKFNLLYEKKFQIERKQTNFIEKIFHELMFRKTSNFLFKAYLMTLSPDCKFSHHDELLHLIHKKGVVEDENGCNNTLISHREEIQDVNLNSLGNVYIQYRESCPLNLFDFSDSSIFPYNAADPLDAIGLFFSLPDSKYHYAIINSGNNYFALGSCVFYQREKVLLTCFFEEYVKLAMIQEFEEENLTTRQSVKQKNLKCAIDYTNSLIQGLSCDLRSTEYRIYLFTSALYKIDSKEDLFQKKLMRELGWDFNQRVIQDGYKLHHLYSYSENTPAKINHLSLAFGLGFIPEPRPNFIKSAGFR